MIQIHVAGKKAASGFYAERERKGGGQGEESERGIDRGREDAGRGERKTDR